MAVKLHKAGYERAVAIIKNGLEIEHDSNNWQEEKPTKDEESHFINTHSLEEYGQWFLGVNSDADPKSTSKFAYPWGDFNVLHKSALVAAEKDATRTNNAEIKDAAQKLLAMISQGKK